MSLGRHRDDWEQLAAVDPLWAVLTDPARKGGGWSPEAFFATGEEAVADILVRARQLGRPERMRAAFDFGCGAGRLTRALAGRFGQAVGVDIAEGMVETARRLSPDVPNLRFERNERPDLAPWDTGSFDLVLTSLVLQHLPDRALMRDFVAELLRITAPGGVLVFDIPVRLPLVNRLGVARRLYTLLRRLGVREETLLLRTPLTPMRMTTLPQADVEAVVEANGGELLAREPLPGAPLSLRYYAAPAAR